MKKIIVGLLFLVSCSVTSQNLRYGFVTGANFYDIEIKGALIANSGGSYFNFGGFVDYKLNDRFGVKANLIYTNTEENGYFKIINNQFTPLTFSDAKLKTLQLHPVFKFDVRNDYSKGFHFLGGFRTTYVLDAKSDKNQELDDFYHKVNFGGLMGFGTTFLKNFSIELVGDFDITNTVTMNNSKTKNTGAYFNLLYNLEPLFNKNK
jgi:hypothetical protein